ncbi:Metallopeptidase family M24 [Thalassoglobus neptunius]|uniref:Metallopeptidase family M24 n=1 Tax=Thalassoglobus neptunius TaxID=1938619 RepID=A0A5C5VRL6_9PLAN|nr:M24 family metallopeptidase [Thalassoglobus neptunius]TWT40703.1 Metallopeptidase family M24 [Thalassoglobus neptunius]
MRSSTISSTAVAPDFPVSSGEIQTIDFQRIGEVDRKHTLLTEYLQLKGFDGLLIRDPANFSWLTDGSSNLHSNGPEVFATVMVTADARVVLCNNIDSGQLFDRDLSGLGFLLKERPWTEDPGKLVHDVCRGRVIACDVPLTGTTNVRDDLQSFRLHYSKVEHDRFSELGLAVAHAVEATGRNFQIGACEAEIAGHLSHRLIKNGIEPVRMQVMADGQGWRYRHWTHGNDRVERHVVIAATGRRRGLHVSTSRTVCLGQPSSELQEVHHLATLVQATGAYFSRAGWSMSETWPRVGRIYEKFGVPDEWRSADQAELVGYRESEIRMVPGSDHRFEYGQVICWHPSVRSGLAADTMLIREGAAENLTPAENWPMLSVEVKGTQIDRPGILVRS